MTTVLTVAAVAAVILTPLGYVAISIITLPRAVATQLAEVDADLTRIADAVTDTNGRAL
ncbi:hypothetical protein [Nocardiopsis lucentensis]|uniref:hypothetical protein n=1 Tax=Nocardiopsis lucentensis TaxID=53441 RepID=UPI00034ABF06|nr:hypothetical protein [Nocardiopsis lucentensis]